MNYIVFISYETLHNADAFDIEISWIAEQHHGLCSSEKITYTTQWCILTKMKKKLSYKFPTYQQLLEFVVSLPKRYELLAIYEENPVTKTTTRMCLSESSSSLDLE